MAVSKKKKAAARKAKKEAEETVAPAEKLEAEKGGKQATKQEEEGAGGKQEQPKSKETESDEETEEDEPRPQKAQQKAPDKETVKPKKPRPRKKSKRERQKEAAAKRKATAAANKANKKKKEWRGVASAEVLDISQLVELGKLKLKLKRKPKKVRGYYYFDETPELKAEEPKAKEPKSEPLDDQDAQDTQELAQVSGRRTRKVSERGKMAAQELERSAVVDSELRSERRALRREKRKREGKGRRSSRRSSRGSSKGEDEDYGESEDSSDGSDSSKSSRSSKSRKTKNIAIPGGASLSSSAFSGASLATAFVPPTAPAESKPAAPRGRPRKYTPGKGQGKSNFLRPDGTSVRVNYTDVAIKLAKAFATAFGNVFEEVKMNKRKFTVLAARAERDLQAELAALEAGEEEVEGRADELRAKAKRYLVRSDEPVPEFACVPLMNECVDLKVVESTLRSKKAKLKREMAKEKRAKLEELEGEQKRKEAERIARGAARVRIGVGGSTLMSPPTAPRADSPAPLTSNSEPAGHQNLSPKNNSRPLSSM